MCSEVMLSHANLSQEQAHEQTHANSTGDIAEDFPTQQKDRSPQWAISTNLNLFLASSISLLD